MGKQKGQPCIVCKKRKQVYANNCCERCNALVNQEGTHDQFGVPKEPEYLTRMRQRIDTYNKLVLQGLTRAEIAQKMDMTIHQVNSLVYRAKKRRGLKVMNMQESRFTAQSRSKPTAEVRPHRNEHGGGKWGIRGCNCDLCKAVRKKSRSEYAPLYLPRKRELKALAAKAKPAQKQVSRDTPEPKPSPQGHGEGLTGKRNCRCEVCGPMKNAYTKAWRLSKIKPS